MTQCGAAPFDGRPDRKEKRNVVDRPGKEFNRACLHRLHGHGYVRVAGNENDWHVRTPGELLLQFEAAQPWKCQVEDQTAREGATWVGRSEEHTSELQSQFHLVCRLLLEKKN